MPEVKAPRWVEKNLLIGEKVIAMYSTDRADFYATDKRLLRFSGKSKYRALEYNNLTIQLIKHGLRRIISGVMLFIVGIICIIFGILGYIGPRIYLGGHPTNFNAPFEIVLLFMGIGVFGIVMAFLMQTCYYQIESPDIAKYDMENWRILPYLLFNRQKPHNFAKVIKVLSYI